MRESGGGRRHARDGAMQVLDGNPAHVRRTDSELPDHDVDDLVGEIGNEVRLPVIVGARRKSAIKDGVEGRTRNRPHLAEQR